MGRLEHARGGLRDRLVEVAAAALLATLGYAASSGAMMIIGEIKRIELWLLGAAVVSILGCFVIKPLMARVYAAGGKDG